MEKIDTHHHILPPKYVQGRRDMPLSICAVEVTTNHSMDECVWDSEGNEDAGMEHSIES